MTDTETLENLLNAGEPWGLLPVLETLARAVEHLLREHDCDVEGHEEFQSAAAAAREIVRRFDTVPWPRGSAPVPENAVAAMQSVLAHMVERGAAHVRPRHGFLSLDETRELIHAWDSHQGTGNAPVLCWGRSPGQIRLGWASINENVPHDAPQQPGKNPPWLLFDYPPDWPIVRSLAIWPDGVESWLRGTGTAPAYDPRAVHVSGLDAAALLTESPGYPWNYSLRSQGAGLPEHAVLTVRTGDGDQERERVILSSPDASPGVMHLASFAPDMAYAVMRLESDLRERDALIVAQAQEIVAWRLAMDDARRDAPVNVQVPGSEGARLQMALLRARREADAWRERALRAESAR